MIFLIKENTLSFFFWEKPERKSSFAQPSFFFFFPFMQADQCCCLRGILEKCFCAVGKTKYERDPKSRHRAPWIMSAAELKRRDGTICSSIWMANWLTMLLTRAAPVWRGCGDKRRCLLHILEPAAPVKDEQVQICHMLHSSIWRSTKLRGEHFFFCYKKDTFSLQYICNTQSDALGIGCQLFPGVSQLFASFKGFFFFFWRVLSDAKCSPEWFIDFVPRSDTFQWQGFGAEMITQSIV